MTNFKAIYPGTFDPITKGHLEVIKRASKIFPYLIVAVAQDTVKSTIFDIDERVEMVLQDVSSLIDENHKILAKPFSGLLVEFARIEKIDVLIRGLRAASDFEYEFQMAYMNSKINSEIETLFLPSNESSHFISSRFVKETARLNGKVEKFVTNNVATRLYEYYNKN